MLLRFRHVLDPLERGSAVVWHPRMPIGRPMRIVWTQGLATTDRVTSSDDPWQRIVLLRMANRDDLLSTGDNTKMAEDGLNLGRCVYFYVDRCVPDYSICVIMFHPPADCAGWVSPFDTGGLFHHHLTVDPPDMDLDGRAALVAQNSHAVADYGEAFASWVTSAFDSIDDYVDGMAPRAGAVPGLSCEDDRDPRHWTWEVRVPKDEFPVDGLEPVTAFMSRSSLRAILVELAQARDLSSRDRDAALMFLSHLQPWADEADGDVATRMPIIKAWLKQEVTVP